MFIGSKLFSPGFDGKGGPDPSNSGKQPQRPNNKDELNKRLHQIDPRFSDEFSNFIRGPKEYFRSGKFGRFGKFLNTLEAIGVVNTDLVDFSRDEVFELLKSTKQELKVPVRLTAKEQNRLLTTYINAEKRLEDIANKVFSKSLEDFSSYFILQFPKYFIKRLALFSNDHKAALQLLDTWYESKAGKEVEEFWSYAIEKGFPFDPKLSQQISKKAVVDVFRTIHDLPKEVKARLDDESMQQLIYENFTQAMKEKDKTLPETICSYVPINPKYIVYKLRTAYQDILNQIREDLKHSHELDLPLLVANRLSRNLPIKHGDTVRDDGEYVANILAPCFTNLEIQERRELAAKVRSATKKLIISNSQRNAGSLIMVYNHAARLLNQQLSCGFKKICPDRSDTDPATQLYKLINKDDIELGSRADRATEPIHSLDGNERQIINKLIEDIQSATKQGQTVEQFVRAST